MSQFVYQPFVAQDIPSIAALIARSAEPYATAAQNIAAGNAHAAEAIAQARARATEVSGDVWGRAIQGIGQSVAQLPQQIQQQKMAQQDQQIRGLQVADLQRRAGLAADLDRARASVNALADDPDVHNPDGTFNIDGILRKSSAALPNGDQGPVQPVDVGSLHELIDPINASIGKAREAQRAYQTERDNTLGLMSSKILTAMQQGANPLPLLQMGLASAKKSGLLSDQELNQGLMVAVEHPEQIPALLQHYVTQANLPPIKLGKDEVLINPANPSGAPLASNIVPPKPSYDAVDVLFNGQPSKAQFDKTTGKFFIGNQDVTGQVQPIKPLSSYEQKPVLLDGKPAFVNFDSKTGKSTIGGQEIDPARIRPVPPASITIQNMRNQAPTLPDWATDDSRPAGADANKPDSTIRMTPNGLHQAALNYIATGQYPPTGRGSDPVSLAQREAINSKVGAIAAAAGMDVPSLRAFYKANSGSLNAIQKSYDSVQSFMATADRNANLLQPLLDKIPDAGSALFNQPLRALDQKALGSVPMSQFKTYIQSIQNEYARILTQPNLAGQLTDNARQEAEKLIDQNATAAQIIGSIRALNAEGGNRLQSLGDQIQTIQQRIQHGPNQNPPPSAPAGGAPDLSGLQPGHGRSFSSGPYKGQVWTIGPDGKPVKVSG